MMMEGEKFLLIAAYVVIQQGTNHAGSGCNTEARKSMCLRSDAKKNS